MQLLHVATFKLAKLAACIFILFLMNKRGSMINNIISTVSSNLKSSRCDLNHVHYTYTEYGFWYNFIIMNWISSRSGMSVKIDS